MPLVVSPPKKRVILGLMTFGTHPEQGARITDLDAFNEALDIFQQRGYNEVDTARTYVGGTQEAFTKAARWKERGLTLATKVQYPNQPGDNTAAKVVASVETSLRELGTDCVDILYLHRPDRGVPFAQTLKAMDQLHKAGKFVRFGISNFSAFEVAEVVMTCKHHGWVRPTVYQGMYNCITRGIESELMVACRRYGLDVVVYNPLAGGLFSGKIKSADMRPEAGRFSDSSAMGARYRERYFADSTFRALQVVEQATAEHGLSMIETALRWLVHHSALDMSDKGHDGVLIGVSSVAQVGDNLDHLEKGPLPEDVVRALDEAWAISKPSSTHYWHGELSYSYNAHEALFGPAGQ